MTKAREIWSNQEKSQAPGNKRLIVTVRRQGSIERFSRSGDGLIRPGISKKKMCFV